MVEHLVANENVESSNLFARSKLKAFIVNNSFCASLWWNVFYKEFPVVGKKPCCNWEGPSITSDPNNKDPNELINHPDMQTYRQMSLRGEWPSQCIRCKTRQEQGLKSYRETENARANVTTVDQLVNATPEVRTIDYRASNLCNLKCRMCNPAESSQLYSEMKKHPELQEHFSNPPISNSVIEIADNYEEQDINKHIASHELFKKLEELKIFGGEPSIDSSVHNLLEWAIDNNYSKLLRLRYTTNATNTNPKWMNYHKHFRNFNVSFSLDAAGETFEYIRTPAKWNTVRKCVLDYVAMKDAIPNRRVRSHCKYSANIVYSLWSCFTIKDWHDQLINLLQDNDIAYNLAISFRKNQAVNILPQKYKDIILESIDKLPQSKFKTSAIQLTSKPAPDDWKNQLKEFFTFSQKYDIIRHTSIFNLSPVYQDLYNTIKD